MTNIRVLNKLNVHLYININTIVLYGFCLLISNFFSNFYLVSFFINLNTYLILFFINNINIGNFYKYL